MDLFQEQFLTLFNFTKILFAIPQAPRATRHHHRRHARPAPDKRSNLPYSLYIAFKGLCCFSGRVGRFLKPLGIKPNNPDQNNGYLGFIDPTQYLPPISLETSQSQPIKLDQSDQLDQSSQSSQVLQSPQEPQPQIIEKEVIKEIPVEKIVEKIVEVPVVDQEEVQKLAEEKIKASWQQYQSLGNKAKQDKKRKNLNKIIKLAQTKKQITNQDIRDLLHVSQSTATAYLTELVNRGMLKIERRSNQTIYSF